MRDQKPIIRTVFAMLLMSLVFITYHQWHQNEQQALADENKTLEQNKEKLEGDKEKLSSVNDYLKEQSSENKQKNGYLTWPGIEDQADILVQESEGAFKKAWAMYLVKESKRYDLDPYLVYELLKVETGGTFDPELVGPETKYGRAYGMSQFMKNTAPWIADMAGLPYEEELLFDPYYSMQLSLVYLDYLNSRYQNWDEALTAYHRGMSGLEQYKSEHGHAESWYAVEIQENAEAHTTLASAE